MGIGHCRVSISMNIPTVNYITVPTVTKKCPYCGVEYESDQSSGYESHPFYRVLVERGKDTLSDIYVETCLTEFARFLARNVNSAYTNLNGERVNK